MQIKVPSALAGAGVAALAFLALGAQSFSVAPISPPIVVEGIPTPEQLVAFRLVAGTGPPPEQFDVPSGKRLVITELSLSACASTSLLIDGQQVTETIPSSTKVAFSPGVAAGPGSIVQLNQVTCSSATAWVRGYLADA